MYIHPFPHTYVFMAYIGKTLHHQLTNFLVNADVKSIYSRSLDMAPPSAGVQQNLRTELSYYAVYRFTATLDISPQIAANEQRRCLQGGEGVDCISCM